MQAGTGLCQAYAGRPQADAGRPRLMQASMIYAGFKYMQAGRQIFAGRPGFYITGLAGLR
jgi:hypothetical protein